MNIKDAKQEIIHTIRAYTAKTPYGSYAIPSVRQRPLLLIGPPGIGKTAVMEQAAAACGVGFVSYTMTHHTRQSAIGLPYIERRTFNGQEYAVTEYTMSEIIASVYRCMEQTGCREGLLFLDEINCVSETLAPAILQFLQNKTFGSHHLPEGWILAAAGNPPDYNKSVREFDIVTLDRLKYIQVEADYRAWRPYALETGIHPVILSYLDTKQENFYLLEQTYRTQVFATARGWEDLSCLLLQYESLKLPITSDLIGQYLHSEDLARDFNGYYHLFEAKKRTLPVSEMINGEESAAELCLRLLKEMSFDEKLYLVHLMLSYLNNQFSLHSAEQDRLKRFDEMLDRFLRFCKLEGALPFEEAFSAFYKNEQHVQKILREHALSSDRALEDAKHTLYDFRNLAYQYQERGSRNETFEEFFASVCSSRSQELENHAQRLLSMLARCVDLLKETDGPEFTVFLSSLYQNPLAAAFLKKHPSKQCGAYYQRLRFESREQALREELQNLFTF